MRASEIGDVEGIDCEAYQEYWFSWRGIRYRYVTSRPMAVTWLVPLTTARQEFRIDAYMPVDPNKPAQGFARFYNMLVLQD